MTWHDDDRVVVVAPLATGPTPTESMVRWSLDRLAERGVHSVLTGALVPDEQEGFRAAGFAVREHLHLLAHNLLHLPDTPAGVRTRRARRPDRPGVLDLDRLAFDDFWRLDRAGLGDAVAATASTRFRVIGGPHGPIVGYAITGRGGPRGYLQRLAVHPAQRQHGLGRALVVDGLRWLRRRGADEAMVNTQEANGAALDLYQSLGFRRMRGGLDVLIARL